MHVREVECPYCQAKIGERCVSLDLTQMYPWAGSHKTRVRLANGEEILDRRYTDYVDSQDAVIVKRTEKALQSVRMNHSAAVSDLESYPLAVAFGWRIEEPEYKIELRASNRLSRILKECKP